MNTELKRAIEEVIESAEATTRWASQASRLDMMEVLCSVYQLKRVFADELKTAKNRTTKRKITVK